MIERCRVPNDKDLRMVGDRKIRLDERSPGMVGVCVEPFRRWRSGNTGGPDNSLAKNAFAVNDDSLFVDRIDTLPKPHLDPSSSNRRLAAADNSEQR